jgi:catechol 2,3-dioxygenase-like lactoylglutathione lyase family enzyme
MYRKWIGLIPLALCHLAFAQLPEFYKKVDRITWVVDDVDRVTQGWKRIGFDETHPAQTVVLDRTELRGIPAKSVVKVAAGRIGQLQIRWIQPVDGKNAYSEFLARHGSGVFSLVHRVPSKDSLKAEIERLAQLGVRVLEKGDVSSSMGSVSYAYMDTEKEGKYSLGLIYVEGGAGTAPTVPSSTRLRLSQFAFVAGDTHAVSAYWKRLGFPEMSFTHSPLRDIVYHGKTGQFDQELGWQRHGEIVYEWILPLRGPTAYLDHMKIHGEGLHHLAFDVEDIDRAAAQLSDLGYPLVQSGAWGEKDKAGSGRFAYNDTGSIGGIMVELLWNFR